MNRTLKALAVPTLTLVVGLVAGAALGQRQGFGMGMGFLEAEEAFSLGMHVEVASCIRVGDTARALELLDTMIDSAVVDQHARPEPHRALTTLADARLYRRAVPAHGPNAAAVNVALANVPEPERPSPRLAKLVTQSGK